MAFVSVVYMCLFIKVVIVVVLLRIKCLHRISPHPRLDFRFVSFEEILNVSKCLRERASYCFKIIKCFFLALNIFFFFIRSAFFVYFNVECFVLRVSLRSLAHDERFIIVCLMCVYGI